MKRKSESSIKPFWGTHTDISRWLATINKTFPVDCVRLQAKKSKVKQKQKAFIHSRCTFIFSLLGRLQPFYYIVGYIIFVCIYT